MKFQELNLGVLRRLLFCLAVLLLGCSPLAAGPKKSTLYSFSGSSDGGSPFAGVIADKTGALYGTTGNGGDPGCSEGGSCGVVFQLSPPQNGGSWTENVLYTFGDQSNDGSQPQTGVVFDQSGNLYGTTQSTSSTLFQLTPRVGGGTPWTLATLAGSAFGPFTTPFVDPNGNLYSTGTFSGAGDCGDVFELSPQGGTWTKTVLFSFSCTSGPSIPKGGLVMDKSGNLYGITVSSGTKPFCGTVFELTPPGNPNDPWTETTLHTFTGKDGCNLQAGLTLNSKGALFGTTWNGGDPSKCPWSRGCGTVFRLTPPAKKGGAWTIATIHRFTRRDGANPVASLVLDRVGNLYGTTYVGGSGPCGLNPHLGCGIVFELSFLKAQHQWKETILHDFQAGLDGSILFGGVILRRGALFGTTYAGGANDYGSVFEIVP